ncbi:MAG: glycosyltransferase family 2 protein [Chitinophagales bacterium]|nr:glycosyltransferase family 2 protein [Bacteroidota bacterium]
MTDNTILISIVSPVYNGAHLLDALVARLTAVLDVMNIRYEIVLVDDGSSDDSWQKIRQLASYIPQLKGLKLCQNFGHHNAITAGIARSVGVYTSVIDCDLQEDPVLLQEMLPLLQQQGYELVLTRKDRSGHKTWRNVFSKTFFMLFRLVSGIAYDNRLANFCMFDTNVRAQFLQKTQQQKQYLIISLQKMDVHKKVLDASISAHYQAKKSTYSWRKLEHTAYEIAVLYASPVFKFLLGLLMPILFYFTLYASVMLYMLLVKGLSYNLLFNLFWLLVWIFNVAMLSFVVKFLLEMRKQKKRPKLYEICQNTETI